MIKSLTRLLGNIVGRIKQDMGAYYLTFGAIFVPTGFIVLLEYHDKLMSGLCFLIGMVSLLIGSIMIQRDERKENKKSALQTRVLLDILDELKAIRGDKDDKPNIPK